MYTSDHEYMVEEKCYNIAHMQKVFDKIKDNFPIYFSEFLRSQQSYIAEERVDKLRDRFIVDSEGKMLVFDEARALQELMHDAIIDYGKDRLGYQSLFDLETLDEYSDDPQQFKSVALKNETAIIRRTIQNKYAKKLDKFRSAFNRVDAKDLLNVVTKLAKFAYDYVHNIYDSKTFENTVFYKDFGFTVLDTDEYTVHGVIGGGIKSTMLYKNYPEVFPCRSRMALWALWYLVDKDKFGCSMDSEFIMIDVKKNSTQQNYFYPYELFAFYSLQIYLLIDAEAKRLNVPLDKEYRFVYVEAFLNFVASLHSNEIDELSKEDDEQAYV